MIDFVAMAMQYRADVLGGVIPACRLTIQACQRSERDHRRQHDDPAWSYHFDPAKAARACRFISGLKHVKSSVGTDAGTKIELLGFQAFLICELFGWVHRRTGARRWRKAWFEVGKGNAKSTLASTIALYVAFAEGTGGADVLCAASMREQARIVLDAARQMCIRDKSLCEHLGIVVQRHDISQPASQSKMWALPARASSVEGVSPCLAVLDEVHAARGRELFDVLSTALSKRKDSLLLMVTTAGSDSSGIGFELHQYVERVLNQEVDSDSFFALPYGIDATDAWDDPRAWQKANPAWGVSVDPVVIAEEAQQAQVLPGQRQAFRIFHLSEWIPNGGDIGFLEWSMVSACYDRELCELDFVGTPAVMGLDLASKLDLCSAVRVHCRVIEGKPHFFVFASNFLPSEAVKNSSVASIRTWEANGQLIVTPGSITNYDMIEEKLVVDWAQYRVRDLNYDPAQAAQLITHLKNRTGAFDSFIEITQFARNMTSGMLWLQEIVADGRLHTNSQVLLWCLGNLRAQVGGLHFVWPVRPKDREQKIDAAVALVMAGKSIAALPLDEVAERNPYASCGIILLDRNYKWRCEHEGCEAMIQGGTFCRERGG